MIENSNYISTLGGDEIKHYGTKRHSGRYPWGSGQHPYQDEPWFKGWSELLSEGKNRNEIAKAYGMSQKELTYRYSYAKDAEKAYLQTQANEMRYNKQMSESAIAKKMGVSVSTVKTWLDPVAQARTRQTEDVADALTKAVKKNKYIDVGKGVEAVMGIKASKKEAALTILTDEGYILTKFKQKQATTDHETEMMVLSAPIDDKTPEEAKSIRYKEIMQNKDKIRLPYEIHVNDAGVQTALEQPVSISSKRIQVLFDEDGGSKRDGLIEIRPGVKDLDLGGRIYAQVRIGVDDTHYMKGMAVYNADLPKGVDVRYNVHYTRDHGAFKKMETDPEGNIDRDNPFGAQIRAQMHYTDAKGNEQLGAVNIVNEQGKWGDWTSNRTLASQVLSKQNPDLAKKQLNLDYTKRAAEYEEIKRITNPVVRAQELNDFADTCDKGAVHLKAAAMPGQSVKVLLPAASLKENEIYCTDYKDGEKVCLIRYPHGSKAEMPICVVNNKNRECRKMIGTAAPDACVISKSTAERLSGADFDGDTVVVIPNRRGQLQNAPKLKMMHEGQDLHEVYANPPGAKRIAYSTMQTEMGKITNLITDMTLSGSASDEEIARAVEHSMVVIDSYKHNLDYRRSEQENGIRELYLKYQGKSQGGASTIISRASGQMNVPERQRLDYARMKAEDTGEKQWVYTEKRRSYTDQINPKTGKRIYKNLLPWQEGYDPEGKLVEQQSTKMYEAKDAMELVSPYKYRMEIVYANYANQLKAMANDARKQAMHVETIPVTREAKQAYAEEIKSLDAKLNSKRSQAPLERMAQISTDVIVSEKVKKYPNRYDVKTPDGRKALGKLKNQVAAQQRALFKQDVKFDITDREWQAIQSGAVSKSKTQEILKFANKERIMELAIPKDSNLPTLSPGNVAHAKAMINSGFTQKEVADSFGISVSTLRKYMS